MATMTLADISKIMKDIDFTMFSTKTDGGAIASRPMSNNGDVEYDGDSFFFTTEDKQMVEEIERDSHVALNFSGAKSLLGKPGPFIAVAGKAELIRDKAAFSAHWQASLDRWFDDGIDTPELVLIKVHASRVSCWDDGDESEIVLAANKDAHGEAGLFLS